MDVNAVIDNLCSRLGVAAEYLIPKVSEYLIASSKIGGIMHFICFVLFLTAFILIYRNGKKKIKKYDLDSDPLTWFEDLTLHTLFMSICVIAMIVTGVYTLLYVYTYFINVMAPEVNAINYILKMAK